jgi:hypothetical protein
MNTTLQKLATKLIPLLAIGLIATSPYCKATIASHGAILIDQERRYQEFLAARSMLDTEIRVQRINYSFSQASASICDRQVKRSIGILAYDPQENTPWAKHFTPPETAADRYGLIVMAVYENSPAAAAGIKAGDIIESPGLQFVDRLFESSYNSWNTNLPPSNLQNLTVKRPSGEVDTKSVWATDICAHFVRVVPSLIHDVFAVDGGVLLTKRFVNQSTDEDIQTAIALELYWAIRSTSSTSAFTLGAASMWTWLFSGNGPLEPLRPMPHSASSRQLSDDFASRLLGNNRVGRQRLTAFLRKIAIEYPSYLQKTSLNVGISAERLVSLQG